MEGSCPKACYVRQSMNVHGMLGFFSSQAPVTRTARRGDGTAGTWVPVWERPTNLDLCDVTHTIPHIVTELWDMQ